MLSYPRSTISLAYFITPVDKTPQRPCSYRIRVVQEAVSLLEDLTVLCEEKARNGKTFGLAC